MKYLLFTYPNCSKCEELKNYLKEISLEGQEHNLILKESKLEIRRFLRDLKRDDKGAIIIPVLVLQDEEEVMTVVNTRQELEDCLKSRA